MSEIEVGEFVRTNDGIIFKLEFFQENGYLPNFEFGQKGMSYECEDEEELEYFFKHVKHSKNIIDLIEVGDIVECVVEQDVDGEDTTKYEVAGTGVTDINGNKTNEIGICGESGVELIPFENVRSILTHQQYKQNCYEVGE